MNDAPRFESPADAFEYAVARLGSQVAMADLVGMTQPAISKIIAGRKVCPHADRAVLKVEAATGVSRHDLRPDLYPRDSAADESDTAFDPDRRLPHADEAA